MSEAQTPLEEVWGDVWEHARLLADRERTRGLVDFLARNAPGRTVVEVGCGTGLLSCIAARLGARSVVGIEPTRRHRDARRLVQASGLSDRVEILHGRVQDLDARPADLVFSELLNAEPFAEGVVPAMRAARDWCRPGGLLAPAQLDLHVCLVAAADVRAEIVGAWDIVDELGQAFQLDVSPILESLEATPPRLFTASSVERRSASVRAVSIDLGVREDPPARVEVDLVATEAGPVCGAALWFSAPYDAELSLANPPEKPGHWGIQVTGWTRPVRLAAGQPLRVLVDLDMTRGVQVTPS
ncbi:class I SAM-dependent methyltransferase [Myxococcota bacterium]|nr:class I SAM-dependent methyltransferase [Myxococcota bacterium]